MAAAGVSGSGITRKQKVCRFCNKSFAKVEHLDRHQRSHTKEKPFKCEQCGGAYGRYDTLLRHIRTQHAHDGDGDGEPKARVNSHSGNNESEPLVAGEEIVLPIDHSFTPATSLVTATAPINDGRNVDWLDAMHTDTLPVGTYDLTSDGWLLDSMDPLWTQWPFTLDECHGLQPTAAVDLTTPKPVTDLRLSWYTHLHDTRNPSTTGSPQPRSQQLDDEYRQNLQQRLHIQLSDHLLPTTDYLNLCVKLYFKRFHPILPIIHAATFRPSKSNAVLLLSICSIGSLLTGHPLALNRGLQLFERLHKSIINNWEAIFRQGGDEAFAVVQAAFLGQTWCLVSGQSNHLAQFDAFHGTVVSWARRLKVFNTRQAATTTIGDNETAWKTWARTEEKIRLAMALRIHDGEISAILHHEPLMSSNSAAGRGQSDQAFNAPTLQEWMVLGHQLQAILPPTPGLLSNSSISSPSGFTFAAPPPSDHQFGLYSCLEDVSCSIAQARSNNGLHQSLVERFQSVLVACHDNIAQQPHESLNRANLVLWHYINVTLYTDMDLLEEGIGKSGPAIDYSQAARIRSWAMSAGAQYAVVHAMMIKDWLQGQSFKTEPAIHVPRVVFAAAVVLYCWRKYGDEASGNRLVDDEFQNLNISPAAVLSEVRRQSAADLLCCIADSLPRIGHWPVSKRLANILDLLVLGENG